jgi:hypothetical protein
MNLHKKFDADNRICASRTKGQHSSKPVGQAVRANSSEVKPDAPWAGRLAFVEDFMREHSLSGQYAASIEILSCF